MTEATSLVWASWLQAVGSILSVLLAGYAALKVHQYTKKKDQLGFLIGAWSMNQEINLFKLGNPLALREFELMIYGTDAQIDDVESRKLYHIFLMLNQVYCGWLAYNEGIIKRDLFESVSAPIIRLVAREGTLLEHILTQRGYHPKFADCVRVLVAGEPLVLAKQKNASPKGGDR